MNWNANLQWRLHRHLASACLILALLPTFAFSAPPADQAAPYEIPDLLVLVLVTERMDNVSFTYQKVVKRDVAEAHLGNLLRETGWTANSIRVEDLKMADGSATTTIEFTTLGTVNLQSGGFPLEPIIKAFKDLGYLEIQFMVSMPFKFQGLRHLENKHVKIGLNRGTNVYGYSVFIKDPDFTTLNLPLVQSEATEAPKSAYGKRSNLLVFGLIVVLGLFAAMLVYCVTKRVTGSRER